MKFFPSAFSFPEICRFRHGTKIETGNFCNCSGQLLPAAGVETDFLPVKASIFAAGTSVAQQVFA
jgi:hypothetical protein